MAYLSKRGCVIDFVEGVCEAKGQINLAWARLIVQKKYKANPNLVDKYLEDKVNAGELIYDKETGYFHVPDRLRKEVSV